MRLNEQATHAHTRTHPPAPSEDELGRGMHGKVRLARDTETGERVAVKIVEREGRKRLGAATTAAWNSSNSRASKSRSEGKRKAREVEDQPEAQGQAAAVAVPHARFAPMPSPTGTPGTLGSGSAGRFARWGDSVSSRSSISERDAERERAKERARKQLLWTTDKKVKREIAIMKKCAHENVVRLKEVIDDPHSKKIFMGE